MQGKPTGILVSYEAPAPKKIDNRRRLAIGLAAFTVAALVCGIVLAHFGLRPPSIALVATAFGSILFGLNTVAYEWPITGATAPTAIQNRTHQQMSAIITGDGTATTFTVTHNWGISAAQITGGFPEVEIEILLAAGNTAAAIVTTKSTNAVVFTCTAFTGAGLRVRLKRPWSPTE